jgi:hypothetical protein
MDGERRLKSRKTDHNPKVYTPRTQQELNFQDRATFKVRNLDFSLIWLV